MAVEGVQICIFTQAAVKNKLGAVLRGPRQAAQLDLWRNGKQSTWSITINETEVTVLLLRKRKITQDKLENKTTKRKKLQGEVDKQAKKQAKEIEQMKSGNLTTQKYHHKRSWSESFRQAKHKKKKKNANDLLHATSFCKDSVFKPCSVNIQNIKTGSHDTLDLSIGKFTS